MSMTLEQFSEFSSMLDQYLNTLTSVLERLQPGPEKRETIGHWAIKEADRLAAAVNCLEAMAVECGAKPTIQPNNPTQAESEISQAEKTV